MSKELQALAERNLHCPYCDTLIDDATAVDGSGRELHYGSVSVCAYCAGLLRFEKRGYSKMSKAFFDSLDQEARFTLTRIQTFVARRPR